VGRGRSGFLAARARAEAKALNLATGQFRSPGRVAYFRPPKLGRKQLLPLCA